MPLLKISGLSRSFRAGEETVVALDAINLSIDAGEMVAIVGTSGSGKSTLMNILGCLDRPTSGSYRVNGREAAELSPDELAELRREHFGFIFQRYHLMADLSALGNVEVPAIYAGAAPGARRSRAEALLKRLGLGERLQHRPSQLSGGQQQRVSIARALMNGGKIILADEPTGALDSKSGETVMAVLRELHEEGHTIILVTHDPDVAGHADRVIEIKDGKIVGDRRTTRAEARAREPVDAPAAARESSLSGFSRRVVEALPIAFRSMAAHRVRTFLTMLGIVIGIAAVVAVVGLGEGSRQKVLAQVSDLGVSAIGIYPGKDWGDERAASIKTLVPEDARALERQPYIDSVSPEFSTSGLARYGNVTINVTINGVGETYFQVNNLKIASGSFFDAGSVVGRRQVAVIDDNTRRRLFGQGEDPIGRIIMIRQVPVFIAGVLMPKTGGSASAQSLQVYLPYSSVLVRMNGLSSGLNGLTIRIADKVDTALAERAIVSFLTLRHGTKDFFAFNSDQLRKTVQRTSQTMSLLISSVAVIALIVGGIGVMNIMLVSVTERTKEIGLRMAVGARRLDIMLQFLIEAVAICIAGAMIGIALALGAGTVLGSAEGEFPMIFSVTSIVAACASAITIGLTFGFLPARNAARLDPVDALSRE